MIRGLSLGEYIEGARNFYKFFGMSKGDSVVLVPTTEFIETDPETVEVLVNTGQEIGASVMVCVLPPQHGYRQDPPPPIAEAIVASDLFLGMGVKNSNPITGHVRAAYRARFDSGAKQADLTGGEKVLTTAWARFPPEIIVEIARKMLKVIQSGRLIRMTDRKGTDLVADYDPFIYSNYICGSVAACEYGHIIPGQRATFPLGVFSILTGDETRGVVVLDCIRGKPGKINPPVRVTVDRNRVTGVEGGIEAEELRRVLRSAGNMDFINRIALGLNPKATLSAGLLHPRHGQTTRRAGVIDIGVGDRVGLVSTQGGDTQSGSILQPTISIDDEFIVVEGRLKFLEDPEIRKVATKYGDPDQILSMIP